MICSYRRMDIRGSPSPIMLLSRFFLRPFSTSNPDDGVFLAMGTNGFPGTSCQATIVLPLRDENTFLRPEGFIKLVAYKVSRLSRKLRVFDTSLYSPGCLLELHAGLIRHGIEMPLTS